jgi:hypothetical protein
MEQNTPELISVPKTDLLNIIVMAHVAFGLMTQRYDLLDGAWVFDTYGVPDAPQTQELLERFMDLFPEEFHSREEAKALMAQRQAAGQHTAVAIDLGPGND